MEKEIKKEEINNLRWYEQISVVPKEAQKPIGAGRLKGMTDINPMWRIEKLTEIFGPVGIGWYTETTKEEIIEGANNEKIAKININLYVKDEKGEWSKPIFGTGGSSFVAKEKNGLYTSDECFKMAYTDALSVACKALGMGAKVYWGDSKYAKSEEKIELASKAQVDALEKIYNGHEDKKKELLDKYKWSSFADMPKKTASDLIKKYTAKKDN